MNGVEYHTRFTLVIACRKKLFRLPDVDHVMRNALPFVKGGLRRTDVQMAKDLDGIVIHDLSTEALGDGKRQVRLAAGGRSNDGSHGVQGGFQYTLLISIP